MHLSSWYMGVQNLSSGLNPVEIQLNFCSKGMWILSSDIIPPAQSWDLEPELCHVAPSPNLSKS